MKIQIKKIQSNNISDRNMIISHEVIGSKKYTKAKLMCIMSMKNKLYYDKPFKFHIEDIEQTLIEYGVLDEKFFIALWVANCDIPFKKRIELFGREIVKLAFGFNKGNIPKKINSITERQKLIINDDIITLHLCQRISNINYAINNNDETSFNMYVEAYDDYEKALRKNIKEHSKMWTYLYFCCKQVVNLDSFFYFV